MVMVALDKARDKKVMSRPVRVIREKKEWWVWTRSVVVFDVVQQVQHARCSMSIPVPG